MKTRMNKVLIIGAAIASLFCAGCGKGIDDWHDQTKYEVDPIGVDLPFHISLNYADALYYDNYKAHLGLDLVSRWPCEGLAFAKRGAALSMAKEVYTYSFQNYVFFDGVSGFLYNLTYITSIPHKLLRGLMCMDGVGTYIGGVFKLTWGFVAATVGLVASPVVNTICHPFETLANLTIGIPFHSFGLSLEDYNIPWWYYMGRTNLLMTAWDLVWGAIVHPLVQAALFFR